MDSTANTTVIINLPQDLSNVPSEAGSYIANNFGTIIIAVISYGLWIGLILFMILLAINLLFSWLKSSSVKL